MRGRRREDGAAVFHQLSQAFGYLELLCVNLCLSPWRKEIKSLKTFTGNFVYYVKSILPESVAQQLLSEIGYVATSATEYSLVRKLNEEEAEKAAFEMFLARIECEDLLEVARDMKDLADILQKRAQKHGPPCVGLAKKQEHSQTKGEVTVGESNETPNPAVAYLNHSQSAFKEQEKMEHGESFGLRCAPREIRPVASEQAPEKDSNQNQPEETSTHSCIRSTDSEDFLITYSDIVIGQQPLHFSTTSSSLRAANEEAWLTETRLGLPSCGGETLPHLPSDESGPQALAILNDPTGVSKTPYDYQTRQTMNESKICDAMKHLSVPGSGTIDGPKELKGSVAQQSPNSSNDSASIGEKPKDKEYHLEKLVYPVEETARPASTRSRQVPEEHYHEMKSANLSCGDHDNVDLYSSDHFSHIAGCSYPTPGLSYSGHLDVPILTRPVLTEDQYSGDIPAGIRHWRERCPHHSSLADFDTCGAHVNEPSLDGYAVINKDN
ncbi:PREDICTED: uncharacterized protein LOC106548569 [Thamnophis sirtalis]|uniref:Uncharacterized protein LOC106548569 n=1 Tax=Thamnophis sirtalis TaxID=35019 RepID=A0A6I9YBD0_9SAUR|nr:PREDICTED: uncharacterized protein LOC106548569 [Thamnophis sirtalis]